MANEEQLSILKQGVDVWNQWRQDHPAIKTDLSNADLRKVDLHKANLSETDLYKANFYKVDLSNANLRKADLNNTDLRIANLSAASLAKADLRDADLHDADLHDADLSQADLRKANLRYANLSMANLNHANFSNANLGNANLKHTNLNDADLNNANLIRADLNNAHLIRIKLSNANLSNADLRQAHLSNIDLREVTLTSTLIGWTVFCNVDLSEAKGLDTIRHHGPSYIDIHTIYRSNSNIPEVFLRGAGVLDNFISYMKSLTSAAFEFYSCFISYSSKDKTFAERLHADLQAKGVRTWYAPEDLKIGEVMLSGIDKGIQVHDKLLVVLSEHSVTSKWVEHEVEAALYEESQPARKNQVLFPIRLDDTVMDTKVNWAYRIRQRHIGDFSHWKDHDAYQKAFERLLRDLKAEAEK